MQFNSYIFILFFLPLILIVYHIANRICVLLGKLVLITAGFVFYVYAGWEISAILMFSIFVNYSTAFILNKILKHRKLMLIVAIIFNTAILLYYKYFNFFVDNINTAFSKDIPLKEIALPLGISFLHFNRLCML